ncbi:MAG: tetratricopeptide repeat-containing protein kinase family protein [Myxococcota bacterium]
MTIRAERAGELCEVAEGSPLECGPGQERDRADPALERSGLQEPLTSPGTILGTLVYISPEQLDGRPVDARADQFSFCVALYEALYGERPYPGETFDDVSYAYAWGELRPPPQGTRVPRRLRRVLQRGLAVEPHRRWPSMQALLDELRRLVAPKTRRWLALGLVGGMTSVGVGLMWNAAGLLCDGSRAQLEDAWGEARKREIEQSFQAVGRPYVAGVWERVEPRLDEYADAWAAEYQEACEATSVRKEQSTEVMDLRMGCLHRAKVELAAATRVLANADEEVVRNAYGLLGGLRSLSRCSELEALRAEVEPPRPEEVEIIEHLRALLAEAKAERGAGRYARAEVRMEEAAQRLAEVEYVPLHTEEALERGLLLEKLGRYAESEMALKQVLSLAPSSRQWAEMQRAASTLMIVVGLRLGRLMEGLQHRELAEGLALGRPLAQADASSNLAAVFRVMGRLEEAEVEIQRAIEIREQALGPRHQDMLASYTVLGSILYVRGSYAELEDLARRAISIAEEVLGADHPDNVYLFNLLSGALFAQHELEKAQVEIQRALEIAESAFGNHELVATLHDNLGNVLQERGKYRLAEIEQRKGLAMRVELLGSKHIAVAESRNNLGVTLVARRKYNEAEQQYQRAIALRKELLGVDHAFVATSQCNLAELLRIQGRTEAALELAEQCWSRNQMEDIPTEDRASTAFLLARLLASERASRARARMLAQRAHDIYVGLGEPFDAELSEVRNWLNKHRSRARRRRR